MKIIIMDNYEKRILSSEEVIEQFEGIAKWHTNRYNLEGYDEEDTYQTCLLEIYKAYIKYDYKKDIKFSTFANSFVKNKIKRILRDSTTQKRYNKDGSNLSLDKEYNEEGATLLDFLGYNQRIEDKVTSHIIYKQIINNLTEEEVKLIPVIVGVKSMQMLGDELGISKVAIHKRVTKFKEKVRKEYIFE